MPVVTGEFDVVAEFTVRAVDRLLAAMHRCERFPHSMSVRVDDRPRIGDQKHHAIAEAVDAFGFAIADHGRVGSPQVSPGGLAATSAFHAGLDVVVNGDLLDLEVPPIVPSDLAGIAQVQLGPPTVGVPDTSGTKLTVRMPMRARYKPDPGTARAAEFVHGELRLTVAISQVVSQAGVNVVEIDIKGNDVQIAFAPAWMSAPLSAEDLTGIQLLLRNALRTGFLPSNTTLPDRLKHLQVKTLQGGGGVVAVLLNLGDARGDAASVSEVFVGAGNDFALGVGRAFVLAAFDPVLEDLRTRPVAPVSVEVFLLGTAIYTITIHEASADLQAGKLVLTVKGHAHGSRWWSPNFDFTTKLSFTLAANGDTVDLVPGAITVDTTSTVVDTFAKGAVERGIRNARDEALARPDANGKNAFSNVNDLLSAERNLGQLLRSLLNPAREQPGRPPQPDVFLLLWYNSLELTPSGLALRGSLAVGNWPPAHVEYEPVPPSRGPGPQTGAIVPRGPDFSALKAWIPGGVIDRFEWSTPGRGQPLVDEHRFVRLAAPTAATPDVLDHGLPVAAAMPAYASLCLTVRGSRLSASGPVAAQPVSGSVCGYGTFPVLDGLAVAGAGAAPMVTLVQPGPGGLVEIVGHAAAEVGGNGRVPNRLVHFADDASAARLDVLARAVRESGRDDATTAVVAVLTSKQLAAARHAPDVVYGDGDGGAWERAFGVVGARRPTTLLVSPRGEIAWRHEGPLDGAALAGALRQHLAAGRGVPRTLRTLNLRLGRQVPNFLFELAPGHALTLRKLAGRAAILVFWRSTSKASLEAVREQQAGPGKERADGSAPVVLAINDGEPPEVARRAAAEHGLTATLVPDPERAISTAYGVSLWPTTVLVDAQSVATAVAYGRGTDHVHPPTRGTHQGDPTQATAS